jgi:choice-of-anchor C domain-containing protein
MATVRTALIEATWRVLFCLTLSAVLPTTTDAAAILINGSFEDGPPMGGREDVDVVAGSSAIPGWEVFAVSASAGAVDYLGAPWDVSDGVHAIDLDGRDALFSGVRQEFATTFGRRYEVAFDLSSNPVSGPLVKQLRVTAAGFSQDYTHDSSGQLKERLVWDAIVFSFIATGPTATLSFMSLTGVPNSYGALIDNVRVTVPEPSTLPLLGAGLVAARSRLRRRRGGHEHADTRLQWRRR